LGASNLPLLRLVVESGRSPNLLKGGLLVRRSILALTCLLTWAGAASARLIPAWPYEKLLATADVVVMARAISSTDAGQGAPAAPWPGLVAVETSFEVQAVLKGSLKGNKLTLLHYRFPGKGMPPNAPMLVSFRGMTDKTKVSRAEYLLFLKRRQDNRYEAVSGQVDPVFSVRELSWPRGN
jgi:hypothetical protein